MQVFSSRNVRNKACRQRLQAVAHYSLKAGIITLTSSRGGGMVDAWVSKTHEPKTREGSSPSLGTDVMNAREELSIPEFSDPISEIFAIVSEGKNEHGSVKLTAPLYLSDGSTIIFVESLTHSRTSQNRIGEVEQLPEARDLRAFIYKDVGDDEFQPVGYACATLDDDSAVMAIYQLNQKLLDLLPEKIQYLAKKTNTLHAVEIETEFRGKGYFKELMLLWLK
jgi:hypothetical protein